ncbi:hypothetical protein WJX72_011106 [[Myrmecia] bisecta]|uniref:Protein kinase domain-containing protein n=1 Tax=[Myrmecia] bisecta TaxID=41462 RepID=A0AAW1PHG4_9CHLO
MTATDTLPAACAVSPPPSAPQPASASSASCNVTGYDIQKEASSVVEGDCAVHLASHRESVQKVSVRVYHKACLSQERLQQLHDQTALLADLHHENIVHLVAAYEDAEDVYIILEQSLEQDSIAAVLQRRGGRLTESQAVREVLQPLLSALQCVYAQHGAVRPLLDPSHIHLSDKLKVQLLPSIQPATPAADATPCACDYQPPEQLGGPMMPDADIAAQADVWALGVLAFTIVTGKSPFAGASPQQTQRSVRTCDPALPSWLSAHAKAFISSALKKDASKRAGLDASKRAGLVDLLKHPWIATRQRRSSGLTLIKADWQAAADPCAVAARLKEREFEGHPGRCQVDLFTASSGELLGDHSLALSAASSLEGAQPGSFSHSMHSTSQRALGAGVGLGMHLSLRPAVSLPEGGLPQWPEAAAARTHAQMRTAAASRRDHTLRPLSMDAIREGALAIPGSLHGSQPSSPKPFVFGSFGLAQQIDEIAHKAAGGRQAADAADAGQQKSRSLWCKRLFY